MSDLKTLLLGGSRLTLSTAESITCGRIQGRIGAISGASEFFVGGMTAYTLDQKVLHLGVDRVEAEAVNSVSARVAEQMARGACIFFGSDLAVSSTGYAEPSAERRISAPFAWWGLARRGAAGDFVVASGRVELPGLSRVDAQEQVATVALDALADWLRGPSAAQTTSAAGHPAAG